MSKRKGTATTGKIKKKPKANENDAGLVRLPSPGQGARANEPMPGFVQLKEKYLLTNAYMDLVENAVADAAPPVSPTKKPKRQKKGEFATSVFPNNYNLSRKPPDLIGMPRATKTKNII